MVNIWSKHVKKFTKTATWPWPLNPVKIISNLNTQIQFQASFAWEVHVPTHQILLSQFISFELLQSRYVFLRIMKLTSLCDLESISMCPRYNLKQAFHDRCSHSKFGDPSSLNSRVIVVDDEIHKSWPLWPWNWVKVTHIQSHAGFPWEISTDWIWWS